MKSSERKFRKQAYLKAILHEVKRFLPDPEIFIYVEYSYKLTWEEFFLFSQLPMTNREQFKGYYRNYYIRSNARLIDTAEGKELNTLKDLKINYSQYTYLKQKHPKNYEFLIKNLQRKLLSNRFKNYELLSPNQKNKLEEHLYRKVDESVIDYDNFLIHNFSHKTMGKYMELSVLKKIVKGG